MDVRQYKYPTIYIVPLHKGSLLLASTGSEHTYLRIRKDILPQNARTSSPVLICINSIRIMIPGAFKWPTTLDLGGNISCLRAFKSSEGLSSSESVLLPLSCFEWKFASGSPCKIDRYHLKNEYVYQRISTSNISVQRTICTYVSKNILPLVSTYSQRLLSSLFPLSRKLSSHEKLLKPNLNPQPRALHNRVYIKLIKSIGAYVASFLW